MDSARSSIAPDQHRISSAERQRRYRHRGAVVWLTGLPASGKSTLSMKLERQLFDDGVLVYALDGDNLRHGLSSNLGFPQEDRQENIRRAGEVATLFADAGLVCITAFISPYRIDRAYARAATEVRGSVFYEVYVKADLATCERRDPKGLYVKARRGDLKDLTGVDAPYEAPQQPDLVVATDAETVAQSVQRLRAFVLSNVTL